MTLPKAAEYGVLSIGTACIMEEIKKAARDEPSPLSACFIDETLMMIDTIENALLI